VRVLSVIPGPVFGGGANQMLRLHRPLADRGVETIVVLPAEPGNALERLREGGVQPVVMPLHRLRASIDPRLHAGLVGGFRPEVRALRQLIRDRSVDIVQAHGPTNPHAALAGHREGSAVVWQLLDTRAPMALRRAAMPLVKRLADVITSVGEEVADVHPGARTIGDRCIAIWPPVDAAQIATGPVARAAAREALGVSESAPLVGAVGNRYPHKGYEWLIRATALLRERFPGVKVRALAAPSPPHAAYEASVRAEAVALGLDDGTFAFVDPGSRVPELLAAFDVYVSSSVPRSEGITTAALEAMVCGIPVISADVGAIHELIVDGATGTLVAPLDASALASAVADLLSNRDRAAQLAAAGRDRALGRFGLDHLADLYVRSYELALEHRRGRRASS